MGKSWCLVFFDSRCSEHVRSLRRLRHRKTRVRFTDLQRVTVGRTDTQQQQIGASVARAVKSLMHRLPFRDGILKPDDRLVIQL